MHILTYITAFDLIIDLPEPVKIWKKNCCFKYFFFYFSKKSYFTVLFWEIITLRTTIFTVPDALHFLELFLFLHSVNICWTPLICWKQFWFLLIGMLRPIVIVAKSHPHDTPILLEPLKLFLWKSIGDNIQEKIV